MSPPRSISRNSRLEWVEVPWSHFLSVLRVAGRVSQQLDVAGTGLWSRRDGFATIHHDDEKSIGKDTDRISFNTACPATKGELMMRDLEILAWHTLEIDLLGALSSSTFPIITPITP